MEEGVWMCVDVCVHIDERGSIAFIEQNDVET